MSLIEKLNEAITKGDMELVKKIRDELNNAEPRPIVPPSGGSGIQKPKRKYTKKKIKKIISKIIKSDADYFAEIARIERQRLDDIINGCAGGLGKGLKDMPESSNVLQEEAELDEKMGKKKRRPQPSRPSITYVRRNCPRCNNAVEILSNEVNQYNWDMSKVETSEKVLYRCDKCR